MRIVIKIGGSLSFDENGPDEQYIKKLLPVLRKIEKRNQVIVTIGGGKFIRKYLLNTKKLFITNEQREWIFVELLKSNVLLFSFLLNKKPIFDLAKVDGMTKGVVGGIKPGRSTDTNAAIAARKMNADLLIKLTDVNGIYDRDPKKYKNAKILKHISFNDLDKYMKRKTSPCSYWILDPASLKIIKRNKIKTIIINGKNPKNVLRVLRGERIGTWIG